MPYSISIESNTVGSSGPGSHEYLTLYPPDDIDPFHAKVIRTGPSYTSPSPFGYGLLSTGEVNIDLQSSADAYPDPDNQSQSDFGVTYIAFDNGLWTTMTSNANSILANGFAYNPFGGVSYTPGDQVSTMGLRALNSNSFASSVMYWSGINPASFVPTNLNMAGAVGNKTLIDIYSGHTVSADTWFTDVFAGSGNDDVFGTSIGNYLNGGPGNDHTEGSDGDDTIDGGIGIDQLIGGNGDDQLLGGADVDLLQGNAGADTMFGHGGGDKFDFNSTSESDTAFGLAVDEIHDFSSGDVIDLSTIDANESVTGNQAFSFIGTAAFTAAGQVRYAINGSGTATGVWLNTSGTSGAEMYIFLEDPHLFIASEFVL